MLPYTQLKRTENFLKKDRTFWRAVREFWRTGKAGFALFLISLFFLLYGYVALDYEIAEGWKGHESVQNVLKDLSAFIPVGGALIAIIVGGIDIMMLLSDWFYERREKRIQAEREKAREEGKKEGYAEGYAAAKAENGSASNEAPNPPPKPSNDPPEDKENP